MDELDRILQLLKKGDRRGLELLFHHFYKPLVFYAMNFLVQQEEAEDAVQEVFIKFWEGKRFHAIKNSLRPYLYQSVRNYCLNLLEGKKVVLTEPINSSMDMAENEYLDESEWNTRIDQLYKAVDRLRALFKENDLSINIQRKNSAYQLIFGENLFEQANNKNVDEMEII